MKSRKPSIPYIIWMAVFTMIPMVMVAITAFTDKNGNFSLEAFNKAFFYGEVFVRSLWIALISTAICLVIAYPLAYKLTKMKSSTQNLINMLLMIPMWMNFLLRIYAWVMILQTNGPLDTFLSFFGIHGTYLGNSGAVILGMVYEYLPFMILPIYNALCKIDKDVIEAAHDLGASARVTFQKIIIPLSLPGVISGIIMVFIPSISEFVVADILGGSKVLLFGNVIDQEFNVANNWNLGSGLSIVLMIFIFISMAIMNRHASEEGDNMLW